MNFNEFCERIDSKILTNSSVLNEDKLFIENIYICDLLSKVMSTAQSGDAWITVLNSVNVIAVALLTEVVCVVLSEGIEFQKEILEKAEKEGVTILSTRLNAYEICLKIGNIK